MVAATIAKISVSNGRDKEVDTDPVLIERETMEMTRTGAVPPKEAKKQ